MKKVVVYDLETIINLFTACFYDIDTKQKKQFVLYDDIQQFKDLVNFLLRLKKHKYTLLGFNVLNFDAQLIELILNSYKEWFDNGNTIQEIVSFLYEEAQTIVHLADEEKFKYLTSEYYLSIPHIDLFKQKHYYGKAKMGTSLKWIQFTIRYDNIEEMPIKHDTYVEKDMIPSILEYNWNDVDSTFAFYQKIEFETTLRNTLSEKYNKTLINASEPRMAKEILGKFLCESMGIKYAELKTMQTFRKQIPVKKIIFPYVNFNTPELNVVLTAFKELIINPNDPKQKFEYNFKYHNTDVVLGLGGIHACVKPGKYVQLEGHSIYDIDVVSFYPNLSIQNGLKPYHLGEKFLEVYKHIFDERVKIPKKDPINYVYKIILNSTYGLSKEKNSYLYDPAFTFGITINGQLSILMLLEMLIAKVPSLKILQANTDGITIDYENQYKDDIEVVCKEWEKITKLNLDAHFYKTMIIRDVNNYIAIDVAGEVKKKGIFETEMEYHKNPSFLIIPKTLEAYFVKDVDYKKFVYEHEDMFDFLGAVKKKANFNLNLYVNDNGTVSVQPQQRVTRFYVSDGIGGQLTKDFTDKRKVKKVSILKGYSIQPMNKIGSKNALDYKDTIKYSYYIKEIEKIIFEIEFDKNQLQLF